MVHIVKRAIVLCFNYSALLLLYANSHLYLTKHLSYTRSNTRLSLYTKLQKYMDHIHFGLLVGIPTRSVSNNSINCSFNNLTFGPAYRRYSSNIDVKFQRCNFLIHPTIVPKKKHCLIFTSILSIKSFFTSSMSS